jgi:hypothetical protein
MRLALVNVDVEYDVRRTTHHRRSMRLSVNGPCEFSDLDNCSGNSDSIRSATYISATSSILMAHLMNIGMKISVRATSTVFGCRLPKITSVRPYRTDDGTDDRIHPPTTRIHLRTTQGRHRPSPERSHHQLHPDG